jgi:hypothetical protein
VVELSAADASVAISAEHHHITSMLMGEQLSHVGVVGIPNVSGGARDRRVARAKQDAEPLLLARIPRAQPHADHSRADAPHVRSSSVPGGDSGSTEQQPDALRASADLLSRAMPEEEVGLDLKLLRARTPRLLQPSRKAVSPSQRVCDLIKPGVGLRATAVLPKESTLLPLLRSSLWLLVTQEVGNCWQCDRRCLSWSTGCALFEIVERQTAASTRLLKAAVSEARTAWNMPTHPRRTLF